eukprot:6547680-Pyramimonas_sp.AAC.1
MGTSAGPSEAPSHPTSPATPTCQSIVACSMGRRIFTLTMTQSQPVSFRIAQLLCTAQQPLFARVTAASSKLDTGAKCF